MTDTSNTNRNSETRCSACSIFLSAALLITTSGAYSYFVKNNPEQNKQLKQKVGMFCNNVLDRLTHPKERAISPNCENTP